MDLAMVVVLEEDLFFLNCISNLIVSVVLVNGENDLWFWKEEKSLFIFF